MNRSRHFFRTTVAKVILRLAPISGLDRLPPEILSLAAGLNTKKCAVE